MVLKTRKDKLSYEVIPKIGIGPVRLNMTREEVRRVMAEKPFPFYKTRNSRYETDAFHRNSFQVFYDDDKPHVDYIELSGNEAYTVLYSGMDVFGTEADELVALISQHAALDENNEELCYSYVFPELELSVWRSIIPESSDDEDGQYFSTIGIGRVGYYSKSALNGSD